MIIVYTSIFLPRLEEGNKERAERAETESRSTGPCGGHGYSLRPGTVSHATKLGTRMALRATVPCRDKCLRAEWPLPTKALSKLCKTLEPSQKLSSVFHTTEFEG